MSERRTTCPLEAREVERYLTALAHPNPTGTPRMPQDVEPLVTTNWLKDHLRDRDVRVVDMRGSVTTKFVEPGVEEAEYRGAPEEYHAGHIPGAVYIDWTRDIVDLDDPVPVQVAPPDRFAETMASRGIGDDSHVIAVDATGGQFATRLWWALRYYGHDRVSVLDGGWKRWVAEGRPIETATPVVARASFRPRIRPELRALASDVLVKLGDPAWQILDARDLGQFSGTKRRGPRGGHIPGAIHLPRELFFAESGGFLPVDEVRRRVEQHDFDSDKPALAYCNGGVAATVVLFNLHRLGHDRLTNYDGSWNEWSNHAEWPVEI
jgi:thiosulfate/3-mercaptopyruvate sulfurtransferase